MKRPTVASLKRVNAENLAGLGVERLAEILVSVANGRPELKRRLRMELAAEQGADHLAVEIDKRLAALETSRSKVSWRQRAGFIRDLEALRVLISGRFAELDQAAALGRLWIFMDTAARIRLRVRDKDGSLAAVFDRAARDIGAVIGAVPPPQAAAALVESAARAPAAWGDWIGPALEAAPPGVAEAAMTLMRARSGSGPAWAPLIRHLADAGGDADAYRSTYSKEALRMPGLAAEVALRFLSAGRADEAGALLKAATPAEADFGWESVWIDYLEASGQADAAQAARWASFERSLSVERARAFTSRLADFQDVEAEGRAFDHAARHGDFSRGLRFLMDWPALPEAARMIQARPDDIRATAEEAERWSALLRRRQPAAAELLLRKAAAAAFRRRDFATADRLTQEADSLET